MNNRAGDKNYTRTLACHQSSCVIHCSTISIKLLVADQTTRITTRPRGSIQCAPTPLSPVNTKDRDRGDKEDIPCYRR
ncbi:hypothetical protein Hanom_Chr10g00890181 [Helianthus anomalus]